VTAPEQAQADSKHRHYWNASIHIPIAIPVLRFAAFMSTKWQGEAKNVDWI